MINCNENESDNKKQITQIDINRSRRRNRQKYAKCSRYR